MNARTLAPLCALSLVACGNGGGGDTDDTADVATCPYEGTANGCLIYESEECGDNGAYDGVDGGWFDDSDGKLVVELAPNDDGLQIGFEVLDASGLADGVEFSLPTEVILHLVDHNTDPPTEYDACAGKLTITNYTPGDILWGTWAFQAKTVTGLCGEVDYYTSLGDFINVEYCER